MAKAKSKKMDLSTLSDEELIDLFDESFLSQVGDYVGITEFETDPKREAGSKKVALEVTVIGLAGSPAVTKFKEDNVKEAKSVKIERADKGVATFKLVASETVALNTNDYIIVYKSC